MSVISLQFGQCGNQIGQTLYSVVDDDIKLNYKDDVYLQKKWFRTNRNGVWEPRSVLIDTETKVTDNVQRSNFKFRNVVAKSFGGAANNWAFGYFQLSRKIVDEALNCVRLEVEECDFLTSILNIYGLAGGTGSGVGSYIIEQLRDEYPKKNILNCSVLANSKGEISTQCYNSLLTLSHLHSISSGTILFQNEKLFNICSYILNQKQVSFSQLNLVLSNQLVSAVQSEDITLLNNLTAYPCFKYLEIQTEPYIREHNMKFEGIRSWDALVCSTFKGSRYDLHLLKENSFNMKLISGALMTHGSKNFVFNKQVYQHSTKFVNWIPNEEVFKSFHNKKKFLDFEKYVTLILNSNRIYIPLNSLIKDAWTSFVHGAYLHHYKKFGLEEDNFINAFQELENLLDEYKNI
ncbi:tubulin delta chain-like [Cylas formicarius]|uniref:tubulin delta chain-like n=1 Tax=Cylas formicarius TaxID=197179 RepID=UPI0029587923|nr:tubulin delta chain-like [Cylas formicarius]